jgi:uncharacterized protein YjiS (DUF1127 family)
VLVMGRAEISEASVWLVTQSFQDRLSDARFADAGLARYSTTQPSPRFAWSQRRKSRSISSSRSMSGEVATITERLASLGLSEYAQRFAENDVDVTVLRHLTDEDLKEIGVSLGHRRKYWRRLPSLPAPPPPSLSPRPQPSRSRVTTPNGAS